MADQLVEAKARAYDLLVQLQQVQARLNAANEEITRLSQPEEPVPA